MFRTIEFSDSRFLQAGLSHITVKSQHLKGRGDITTFVPPNVKSVGNNVPIVILLHGVYGSHWAWAYKAGAHISAGHLMASRVIHPMVLAMPSDGLWGDGSGYVQHEQRDFEAWICQDVPKAVQQLVPEVSEDSPIFIAGLSMGGYGALRLGAKYPHLFSGISGHSSITNWEEMKQFVEEDIESFPVFAEDANVFQLLHKNKDQLPPFRFDCGKDDPLIEGNRQLHAQLENESIPHHYEEFSGAHEWPYWEEHLIDSLQFFDQIITGEI